MFLSVAVGPQGTQQHRTPLSDHRPPLLQLSAVGALHTAGGAARHCFEKLQIIVVLNLVLQRQSCFFALLHQYKVNCSFFVRRDVEFPTRSCFLVLLTFSIKFHVLLAQFFHTAH